MKKERKYKLSMQMEQITKHMVHSGFTRAVVNGSHVEVLLQVQARDAYAVVMVDCDCFENMTVEDYENLQRGVRSSLYQYDFQEVRMLNVLCTKDPKRVKNLVEAFGEHWVVDMSENRLLIYENQIASFLNTKEVIEEVLLYGDEVVIEQVEKRANFLSILKDNYCTYSLVLINCLVFLVLSMIGNTENVMFMERHGALVISQVGHGLWQTQMVTSMFLHFGVSHLLNNMFMLLVMGSYLEKRMEKWKYMTIYLGAGLIGNIVSLYYYIGTGNVDVVCAGASGAIFGLTGALLWVIICNHGRIEDISWVQIAFLILLNIYVGMADSTVGNAAHIGGLIGGFLLAIVLYRGIDKEDGAS